MTLPVKQAPRLTGWGGYPSAAAALARPERERDFRPLSGVHIARGQGRSYGDSSLCSEGSVLLSERMNRMIAFDEATGLLTAEAGVTLAEVLEVFVPRGWFVPVTPGTKFCSLGGCLAADVHGKNHHHDGSFSAHVAEAVLADALGRMHRIGPEIEPALFWATAGGMGLTGLITEVTLRLKKVESAYVGVTHRRAANLDEALDMFADPAADDEYTVAWIDCLASGGSLGRSVLMAGHHLKRVEVPIETKDPFAVHKSGPLRVPFNFPGFALNPLSVRAFNGVYNSLQGRKTAFVAHYDKFFYPLDGVAHWNRIYGRRGFVQYQFVMPPATAREGIKEVLERISAKGHASFLAVLKRFGQGGPGLLSFPMEGFTLALDIPVKAGLFDFLSELDDVVAKHGGRQYLAKDSRMKPEHFAAMYPRLAEFRDICLTLDPSGVFRSDQCRRLGILP